MSARHVAAALLLALLAACAAREAAEGPPWRIAPATEVDAPGHLIVTVAPAEPSALARVASALEADHAIELVAEWPLNAISVHCFVFRLRDDAAEGPVLAALDADPRVETAQPVQRFATLGAAYADELLPLQAGLREIDALRAHAHRSGAGVRVGVVDTWPDTSHPDLSERIVLARDFVRAGPAPAAEEHGTAVAGVIAADGANGRGIVGVAPGADLLALRACWQPAAGARGHGRCNSFSLAQALNFAALNRVDVLNLSLAGPPDPLVARLIGVALAEGAAVVAARGPGDLPGFPASLPGLLAAGPPGTTPEDTAFAAPGTDVLSTAPGGAYDYFTGSSISAAHLSGIVALLREARPGFAGRELAETLRRASGGGTASACRALKLVDPGAAALGCKDTEARSAAPALAETE